jgi:hypothetical protein
VVSSPSADVARVELLTTTGEIEFAYFRFPTFCLLLTEESKQRVLWSVDRSTPGRQVQDFFDAAQDLHLEMRHQETLSESRAWRFLTSQKGVAVNLMFILAIAQNFIIMIRYSSAGEKHHLISHLISRLITSLISSHLISSSHMVSSHLMIRFSSAEDQVNAYLGAALGSGGDFRRALAPVVASDSSGRSLSEVGGGGGGGSGGGSGELNFEYIEGMMNLVLGSMQALACIVVFFIHAMQVRIPPPASTCRDLT